MYLWSLVLVRAKSYDSQTDIELGQSGINGLGFE